MGQVLDWKCSNSNFRWTRAEIWTRIGWEKWHVIRDQNHLVRCRGPREHRLSSHLLLTMATGKSSQMIGYALSYFWMFWDILRFSRHFWDIFRHFAIFETFLRHFRLFSDIFRHFWDISRFLWRFWEFLTYFEIKNWILSGFQKAVWNHIRAIEISRVKIFGELISSLDQGSPFPKN